MRQPIVWIVGDWKWAEFGEVVQWLRTQARCLCFDDTATALSSWCAVEGAESPGAILLIQSRPGQISRGDVERLHAAAPLARLVALAGAWCEGELRSGPAWAGVVHVPVSSWRSRLADELGLAGGGDSLRLPRTATTAERIEARLARFGRPGAYGLKAVVYSSRRANHEAIVDLLEQLGCEPVAESGAADVILFDGWESIASCGGLSPEGKNGGSRMRVLLMDFPRDVDFERARREGIDVVLAQPASLADLAEAIGKARSAAAGAGAGASGW